MRIRYAPGGMYCSDFDGLMTAKVVAAKGVDQTVSSFEIIEWLRMLAVHNEWLRNKLVILYKREDTGDEYEITINEKGDMSEWPYGFGDITQRRFADLFRFRTGKPATYHAAPLIELIIRED